MEEYLDKRSILKSLFHLENCISSTFSILPFTRPPMGVKLSTSTICKKRTKTRMHSSRMRTGHSLTVCWRLLPRGWVWSGGVPGRGSGPRGVVSQHALRQNPPVDRQTPVKTLPWPNFVAAGKYDWRRLLLRPGHLIVYLWQVWGGFQVGEGQ